MRLSEDKISHISHLLCDGAIREGLMQSPDAIRLVKQTKLLITKYCQLEDEVDVVVRKKLQSYARKMVEGSRDWEVLYRKHFDEEMKKRWH